MFPFFKLSRFPLLGCTHNNGNNNNDRIIMIIAASLFYHLRNPY